MIPLLLASLAIVDAAFAGFRAAAGRDAHIFKRAYYTRAVLTGIAAGAALVALLAAATAASMLVAADPGALWSALLGIGARMLRVFLGYAILVIAALALYATARSELRILATVSILGPFTILRPWVVAIATAWGVWGSGSPVATALTLAASASVLALGASLDRAYARRARAWMPTTGG